MLQDTVLRLVFKKFQNSSPVYVKIGNLLKKSHLCIISAF